MPVLNAQGLIEERVAAIRAAHKKAHAKRATVGVSGGADSALMVQLAALAVGPENVTAVWQGINSNPAALERAREVCRNIGVKLIECDWTESVRSDQAQMRTQMIAAGYDAAEIDARLVSEPDILGGHRSCYRAPSLRLANRMAGNGMVHGTGNECEDRWMRFFQKGGDGEVDTNFICMFSKGETYQMLRSLPTTPKSILEAMPSPDLWGVGEVHNDDTEMKKFLGMSDCTIPVYSFLDLETGGYKNVGLIERVNRFLDREIDFPHKDLSHPDGFYGADPVRVEDILFNDEIEPDLDTLLAAADASGIFYGIDTVTVGRLLGAARRVEAMTRHKWNPMIETGPDRESMIEADLITNDLPL